MKAVSPFEMSVNFYQTTRCISQIILFIIVTLLRTQTSFLFISTTSFSVRMGKGKVIPIQTMEALRVARGWGSHIFRHSDTDGGKVVSPTRWPLLPPGRFLVLIFVRGWVDPGAIVWLEGLGKLKKCTSSGTWTGDLPACSIVPQPTTLPRAPVRMGGQRNNYDKAKEQNYFNKNL
jgi:hypothetical protein